MGLGVRAQPESAAARGRLHAIEVALHAHAIDEHARCPELGEMHLKIVRGTGPAVRPPSLGVGAGAPPDLDPKANDPGTGPVRASRAAEQ